MGHTPTTPSNIQPINIQIPNNIQILNFVGGQNLLHTNKQTKSWGGGNLGHTNERTKSWGGRNSGHTNRLNPKLNYYIDCFEDVSTRFLMGSFCKADN